MLMTESMSRLGRLRRLVIGDRRESGGIAKVGLAGLQFEEAFAAQLLEDAIDMDDAEPRRVG